MFRPQSQPKETNRTNTSKIISLKELLRALSEKERQNLWITLGGQNPPHWRPLAYHIAPFVNNKLDSDEIDTIELYHQTNPERSKALIIKMSEWPEVSAELFVNGLKAIGLGVLANEMGQKIGMTPTFPIQSATPPSNIKAAMSPLVL